ncbi:MAG: hypothetical protein U5O16_20975 [Rhodococcus sp. (in: high G+C Gram-positive bacteria)]|uniref:hypothetical protein n=1 Tax=Rhodococcus sp. TaxID=1831 RepID=UPI002AD88BD3|nr:hypothetical protein [Rhodococcus sp. (in: high G+C Gram-positive bacteria)]
MLKLNAVYDIFRINDRALREDFALLTQNRTSETLPISNRIILPTRTPIHRKGSGHRGATFNTKAGPIYIGRNTTVMEGCLVRSSFAMGEDCVLKMGAKYMAVPLWGQPASWAVR